MLPRFSAFLRRHEARLEEIFTPEELAAAGALRRRELYLATRWALKEAVLKALGTGWGAGAQWVEVEATGATFRPRVVLHGGAREIAARHGKCMVFAATACADDCVVAMVVLVGAEELA